MSELQESMWKAHGSPADFEAACVRAADDLMITGAECKAAVDQYQREWLDAGEVA
jgi:hypothetical protein